jgi:hypothetical protein
MRTLRLSGVRLKDDAVGPVIRQDDGALPRE